jgi:YHS domain-containing protein
MRILIVLGLAALPLLGCGSPQDRWESRGDRLLGIGSDRAEDPVSGARIAKKEAVKRDYRGATYYFETSETASIFVLNPEEYALRENKVQDSGGVVPMCTKASSPEIPR